MAVAASVVIPTWRRGDQLAVTLQALTHQDDSDFEIVVVSDGEDEALRSVAASWLGPIATKWIFHPENLGLPSARNTGVAAADGDLIVFLDDDVVPGISWIRNHKAAHASQSSNESAHASRSSNLIVLGKLTEAYSNPPHSRVEKMLRERRAQGFARFFERTERNGGSFEFFPHCGNNSSLSKATFSAVGGFDPNLRDMHEDLEMGARARALGFDFRYQPVAEAVHWNSRAAESYETGSTRDAARSDLYRVTSKGQRTPSTSGLKAIAESRGLKAAKERIAWEKPELGERVSSMLIAVAEKTGSEKALDVGRGLRRSVNYWAALRDAGQSPDALSQLVSRNIPALVIHSVSNDVAGEERRYHITVDRFAKSMQLLADQGYVTALPDALESATAGDRRVMLTFDDAYEDFYTQALPTLGKFGFSATVFVVAGLIGQTNVWDAQRGFRRRRLVTLQQLRDMHSQGIWIGSHSLTHPRLTSLNDEELTRELVDSKQILEDAIGSAVTTFAYPSGQLDERVRNAVARAGYTTAFATREGMNGWTDPLELCRTPLSDIDSRLSLKVKLATGSGIATHVRRMGMTIARNAIGALPSGVADRVSMRARRFDAERRERTWDARTEKLIETAAAHLREGE